jgi:hypothetical protein
VPRLNFRRAVGIGLAVAGFASATFVLYLAPASAQPGPGITATVPGTTAGPSITTGTNAPTTTTTTTTTTAPVECHCGGPRNTGLARVETNYKHPVAGETFKGLTFRKIRGGTISWVECDAKIAGKRLPALQQSFFAGPHQRDKVVCRWRIPADAAGKRLRLWTRAAGDPKAWIVHISPHGLMYGRLARGFWSWTVAR